MAQAASGVYYNITDYLATPEDRVSVPASWVPNIGAPDYKGSLDAHWAARIETTNETIQVSNADAKVKTGKNNFNSLITLPDNCWGMNMGYGLVTLAQGANLTITVAADSSSIKPAFGFYRGWDSGSSASRHDTIFFGDNNPLGTQGLTFLGDQLGTVAGGSVSRTFTNLAAGNYELFVTVGDNNSAGGAYKVTLTTTPVGGGITVPGAPTNVTAIAGNSQATVSWTAPANNGGAPITSYTVTSAPGNKQCSSAVTNCTVTGLTNGTSYTFSVVATNSAGNGPASSPSNAVVIGGLLSGLAAQGYVGTNNEVQFGAFTISGAPRKVLIRGLGPALNGYVPGAISNPKLALSLNGALTALEVNDDWEDADNAEEIAALKHQPKNATESAILRTLEPGIYNVHLSGSGGSTGIGMFQVYAVEGGGNGELKGLAAQGQVGTGNQVQFGAFTISGAPRKVLIRGLGPALNGYVPGAISNPKIALSLNGAPTPLEVNDDWADADNAEEIAALKHQPKNPEESAILRTLEPGIYNVHLSGSGGSTGIGMFQVYAVE